MRAYALFLIAMCACSPRLLTPSDILKLSSQPPTAKIAYGDAPPQFAELRKPAGNGPFPVVVVIHGGCWIGYADAGYTAHLASALVKEGWATWNLEYRRGHESGGGWPGTFLDVGRGVDALRDAATAHALDLQRIAVIGHSAGGQLALWVGGRKRLPKNSEVFTADPLPVRGVVSLAGIADMRAYAAAGTRDCVTGELQVVGGTPDEQPARYTAVSPFELLPIGARQVLVWGTADRIVPRSLFKEYEAKSGAEILEIERAGHHEMCSAETPGWARIVAALRRILD